MVSFADFIQKDHNIGSPESIEAFKAEQMRQAEVQGGCCDEDEFWKRIPDPDLKVQIGSLTLSNPITAAAGCYGYGIEYKEYQKLSEIGAVFSLGTTLNPVNGAPQPRMQETVAAVLQNTGYENPGVEYVKTEILPEVVAKKEVLILNICGTSAEEMAAVAAAVDKTEGIAGVELNLSCIDEKSGKAFATDENLIKEVVLAVKKATSLPVIAKLSPNVTDIAKMALAAESAGADAVSLINPLNGMAIDIYTAKPVLSSVMGGVCGPALKPIALKAVYDTAQKVIIPIIGCGGITNAMDVIEFLQAGASAVQIGSANFIQPDCYGAILEDLVSYMKFNGFTKLGKLVGLAQKEK